MTGLEARGGQPGEGFETIDAGLDGLCGEGKGEEEKREGEVGEGKNGKKDMFVYRENYDGIDENLEAKQDGIIFLGK